MTPHKSRELTHKTTGCTHHSWNQCIKGEESIQPITVPPPPPDPPSSLSLPPSFLRMNYSGDGNAPKLAAMQFITANILCMSRYSGLGGEGTSHHFPDCRGVYWQDASLLHTVTFLYFPSKVIPLHSDLPV